MAESTAGQIQSGIRAEQLDGLSVPCPSGGFLRGEVAEEQARALVGEPGSPSTLPAASRFSEPNASVARRIGASGHSNPRTNRHCFVREVQFGESPVTLTGSSVVSPSSLSGCIEHAEILAELRSPEVAYRVDALAAAGVVQLPASIGTVLAASGDSKIGAPVVEPVVIDVINFRESAGRQAEDQAVHPDLGMGRTTAGVERIARTARYTPASLANEVCVSRINKREQSRIQRDTYTFQAEHLTCVRPGPWLYQQPRGRSVPADIVPGRPRKESALGYGQ